jgi:hypothetical protein
VSHIYTHTHLHIYTFTLVHMYNAPYQGAWKNSSWPAPRLCAHAPMRPCMHASPRAPTCVSTAHQTRLPRLRLPCTRAACAAGTRGRYIRGQHGGIMRGSMQLRPRCSSAPASYPSCSSPPPAAVHHQTRRAATRLARRTHEDHIGPLTGGGRMRTARVPGTRARVCGRRAAQARRMLTVTDMLCPRRGAC